MTQKSESDDSSPAIEEVSWICVNLAHLKHTYGCTQHVSRASLPHQHMVIQDVFDLGPDREYRRSDGGSPVRAVVMGQGAARYSDDCSRSPRRRPPARAGGPECVHRWRSLCRGASSA